MSHHLAGGGFDGSYSAQTGKRGLAPEPLGVVFKATTKSVVALMAGESGSVGAGTFSPGASDGTEILRPAQELFVTLRWS